MQNFSSWGNLWVKVGEGETNKITKPTTYTKMQAYLILVCASKKKIIKINQAAIR